MKGANKFIKQEVPKSFKEAQIANLDTKQDIAAVRADVRADVQREIDIVRQEIDIVRQEIGKVRDDVRDNVRREVDIIRQDLENRINSYKWFVGILLVMAGLFVTILGVLV